MGLLQHEWFFEHSEVPSPREVCAEISRQCGLTCISKFEGEDIDIEVVVVELKQELFEWHAESGTLKVCSWMPPNPYFNVQLDLAMCALGGHADDVEYDSDRIEAKPRMHLPWASLTPKERFILGSGRWYIWRPFDRFL